MATAPATERPPTTAPPAEPAEPAEQGGGLYRMGLEQYHAIAGAGILGPTDRVVLIDGVLVSKMTKGPQHEASSYRVLRALMAAAPEGWYVRKEGPITLPDGPQGHPSEPEPDLVVAQGDWDRYTERHPGPAEVALVVDVAKASLRMDREMLARYAWAGIPIVWIVNLVSRAVEVYTDPTGPGEDPRYRAVETIAEGGRLRLVLAGEPRAEIPVRDLLP